MKVISFYRKIPTRSPWRTPVLGLIFWVVSYTTWAQCSTTTYPICSGESYTLTAPSGLGAVQWYKDGQKIAAPLGTSASLVVSAEGNYTWAGTNTTTTCRDSLCCPAKVVACNVYPICPGETYTLTAPTGVANLQWYKDGVKIPAPTGTASSLVISSLGTYAWAGTNSATLCRDSLCNGVKFVVGACKGTLGNYVWKDTNNNGLQDETGTGVSGVILELYKNAIATGLKDTTGATGNYLFTVSDSATYQVKIIGGLPAGCSLSPKQNIGPNDALDSDFDASTGLSDPVTVNPFNLAKKDILTVDAALIIPCVESTFTQVNAPVCAADAQTYSLTFSVTNKLGIIKVNKGVLSGNNPYTITGIPSGASVIITDSLSALCKSDTLLTGPNCNCNPSIPILLTSSLTACLGDTFPTLKATVVGLATVEWFTQATGGTVVFTGLQWKPSGTISATTVYYAQARSIDPACPSAISSSRVAATINGQDCTKIVDLALKKGVDKKVVQIGDVVTYTIKVWNESATAASGVEVADTLATTVQLVTNSWIASRGSVSFTGNVLKWVIGSVAAAGAPANGDTVTLTYQIKATQEGVHFNTAEVSKSNEKDVDSTPANGKESEDDLARQCFTVPIKLCTGEKVQATVPAYLTNVQWYKNGSTTVVATGNTVLLTDVGTYTFTASNQTCPTGGCCSLVIEPGTNCCPANYCAPFIVRKRKK